MYREKKTRKAVEYIKLCVSDDRYLFFPFRICVFVVSLSFILLLVLAE